jgi:hypothetical protein
MEYLDKGEKVSHMAGIVPVAGQPLDYGFPWHDSLVPVGQDYLAVERAVYECALAGCESIWVISHVGTQPLLRKRLGDYITDPVSLKTIDPLNKRRDISIFYVPIHPKDRDKRDCLSWSVLYGADSCFRIAAFLSKWILPDKFYCAFPYGVLPDDIIYSSRSFLSKRKNVFFSYEGKTVRDGLHISFTFNANDYKKCRDIIKHQTLTEWDSDLPISRKTFSKFYTIQQVFSCLDTGNSSVIETDWFYDISTWDSYRKFMASDRIIEKQKNVFLSLKRKKFPNESDLERKNKND